MDKNKKIEYVIEITHVSKKIAINSLELNNWDIMQSIVYIDKYLKEENKIKLTEANDKTEKNMQSKIDKLFVPKLIISKNNSTLFSVPIIILLLLILLVPKIILTMFIISMFFEIQYETTYFFASDLLNQIFNFVEQIVKKIKGLIK